MIKMKYWLKGGVIGAIVLVVAVFLWGSISALANNGQCGFWDSPPSFGLCYGVPYMVLTLPTFYVGNIISHAFYSQTTVGESIPTTFSSAISIVFVFFGGVLSWFLAGALVGFIVAKIRHKK